MYLLRKAADGIVCDESVNVQVCLIYRFAIPEDRETYGNI